MDDEQFKQHPMFSKYKVSQYANIKGQRYFSSKKYIAPQSDRRGYKNMTAIDDEGKYCRYKIHRMVAETWCHNDDPENKREVHHVDFNPANNHASNLEWVTRLENMRMMNPIKNTLSGYKNINWIPGHWRYRKTGSTGGIVTHTHNCGSELEDAVQYKLKYEKDNGLQ